MGRVDVDPASDLGGSRRVAPRLRGGHAELPTRLGVLPPRRVALSALRA